MGIVQMWHKAMIHFLSVPSQLLELKSPLFNKIIWLDMIELRFRRFELFKLKIHSINEYRQVEGAFESTVINRYVLIF